MKKLYLIETNAGHYIATKNKNGIRIIDDVNFRPEWHEVLSELENQEQAARMVLGDYAFDENGDDDAFELITYNENREFYKGILKDINGDWNYYENPEAPKVLATATAIWN